MIHVIKFADHCCNVDNADDLANMLARGGIVLTPEEISTAGMTDHELLVGPNNTTANPDGSITFTPPSAPAAEQLYTTLRAARGARLITTDKYLLADYPINADNLALIKAYRAALRALPDQPGAPWDGGGEETPWPTVPEIGHMEPPCV